MKAQTSLEFLIILVISLGYLSFALSITETTFSKIESAALKENRESIKSFFLFGNQLTEGKLSENFTVFPTGKLDVYANGEKIIISTCGKFSEIEKTEIILKNSGFGRLKNSCEEFDINKKAKITFEKKKGVANIEITNFN